MQERRLTSAGLQAFSYFVLRGKGEGVGEKEEMERGKTRASL